MLLTCKMGTNDDAQLEIMTTMTRNRDTLNISNLSKRRKKGGTRNIAPLIGIIFLILCSPASSFVHGSFLAMKNKNTSIHQRTTTNIFQNQINHKLSSSTLWSSFHEKEEGTAANIIERVSSKLPPPPDDMLTISGDIGCLFLYTFIDHFVNQLFDKWLNSPEIIHSQSAVAAIESASAASKELSTSVLESGTTPQSLPVWFDSLSSAPFGSIPLISALPLEHHVIYAPILSTAGMASVVLCVSWLFSGFWTGAFRFKNTMECSTSRAILITGKTWILSSILMLGIAYSSDIFVGNCNCLHKTVGITKADTDFIFDSLSVLLIWRYIVSSFFGVDDDPSE